MFKVRDVARIIGLGVNAIYAMVSAGEIGCLRVGPGRRSIRFTQTHIDDYLARAEASPVSSYAPLRRAPARRLNTCRDLQRLQR